MSWEGLFEETPSARRRLTLVLYGIVGPVFIAVLLLVRDRSGPAWPIAAVVALVAAGAAALLVQRSPSVMGWIFPVAVSPTVCCGLAYLACGGGSAAYLAVVGAPLAWAAVLFDAPVVVAAFAATILTCLVTILLKEGAAAAVGTVGMVSTIHGLVGWVVFGMARRLREARARLHATAEQDRELVRALERSREEVHRSEERLQLALAAGAHVVWEWDVEADLFTPGPGSLEAAAPGELPRDIQGWKELVHPEDLDRAWRALEECVAGRAEEYVIRYRMQQGRGLWRWVESRGRATRRDPTGHALRILGTRTDVTETEDLHRRLVAATRLASVGTLAAGVAHEINNPLTWMKSNLSCCRDQVAALEVSAGVQEPTRAELQELLAEAIEGADRIGAIVRAMRSLGRPEGPEAVTAVDVRAELLSAILMGRDHVGRHATLEVGIPPSLPTVRARSSELGRAFLNLLVNAAEAIPGGAPAANRVGVSARQEGDEVVVEVTDTGRGFGAEVRAQMFDAFFTTKEVGQGAGLGLTIASAIVDAAGGRMEAEGSEGRGATFRIRLPVSSDRTRSPAASGDQDAQRTSEVEPPVEHSRATAAAVSKAT